MLLIKVSPHRYYLIRNIYSRNNFFGTKSNNNLNNEKKEDKTPAKKTSLDKIWSRKQMPKSLAMKGPRFETLDTTKQPNPTPAIELISKVPIIQVHENIAVCDGGGGKLGHPKIFINLDQKQAISCTYCGLRYQQK